MMRFARSFMGLVIACMLLIGCSHHGRVTATTQVSPAESLAKIPQPPLRQVLRALGEKGIATAPHATVFVLSHWLIDEGPNPDQQRRFEGTPFHIGDTAIFIAVGPRLKGRKKLPPPPEDVIVKTKEDGSRGVTITQAGQDWDLGFTMKHGDEKLAQRLTEILTDWLNEYRAGHRG